jgi:hypothetical protein
MSAVFEDLPMLQVENPIHAPDRGEAMGNGNDRAPLEEIQQRLLNGVLGFRVQRGSGFVQYQDGGVLEQGPGDGYPLALPAGELYALLADEGCITLGAAHDELVAVRPPGCPEQVFLRGIETRIADVLLHRTVESPVVCATSAIASLSESRVTPAISWPSMVM